MWTITAEALQKQGVGLLLISDHFHLIWWSLFVVKLGNILALVYHICQNGTIENWETSILWSEIKMETKTSLCFLFFRSYCRSNNWYRNNLIRPKKKLFDWRNPTNPFFTPYPKYIFFFSVQFLFLANLETNIFIQYCKNDSFYSV